jgi:hypothetical protein
MSKLENKQIIHIATEIVALVGIVFYVSSNNRKLSTHIEDLSQRLEDQEDLVQKHEQIIRQLVQAINSRGALPSPAPSQPNGHGQKPNGQKPKQMKEKKQSSPKKSIGRSHVSFNDNEEVQEKTLSPPKKLSHESSDDDSDLDAEIADELQELQQHDLKKRL